MNQTNLNFYCNLCDLMALTGDSLGKLALEIVRSSEEKICGTISSTSTSSVTKINRVDEYSFLDQKVVVSRYYDSLHESQEDPPLKSLKDIIGFACDINLFGEQCIITKKTN